MSVIVVEAIHERYANFMILTATVSKIGPIWWTDKLIYFSSSIYKLLIQAIFDNVNHCPVAVRDDCSTELAACQAVRNSTTYYSLQYTSNHTSASMGTIR